MLSVVVGGFFGDEGKGKITSYLALNRDMDAVVRAGTGPNAGHTVVHEGVTYKLRLIPSGFTSPKAKMMIGAGVLVKEDILLKEILETNIENRFFIDRHTGVITAKEVEMEKQDEYLMKVIGSTGSGSGMGNAQRALRKLKLAQDFPALQPYCADVSDMINEILDEGGNVLVEGSQSTFLSLYHGTYPYVTSKDVAASGALSDIGVGPTRCNEVIVVFKSFVTRVGEGLLAGELSPEEVVSRGWQEFGTVTGRLRRAAPFDFDLAKKAVRINGATDIALTKMDILYPEIAGKTSLSYLSGEPLDFIEKIEDYTGVPVTYISTGPSSTDLIVRTKE